MRISARRVFAVCVLVAVGLSVLPAGTASAGVDAGIPSLALNRAYTTAPFAGTSTTANSQEGSAYVPADNALWLVDSTHAYEVDASTDQLRRTVATADFTNALPVGGVGAPAGTTRSDSFAAVAYDPTADALYVFSRNCCTATGLDPSVFRLKRDLAGAFQVESYQSLPAGTDPKGAGYKAGTGLVFGKGKTINPYDYDTNTIGATITVSGIDAGGAGHGLLGRRFAPLRGDVRRGGQPGAEQREALPDRHHDVEGRSELEPRPHALRRPRPPLGRGDRRPDLRR